MTRQSQPRFLTLPQSQVKALLRLYDYPDPHHPGRILRGYDKAHAYRTAQMCSAVAKTLDIVPQKLPQFEVACLLHDLGRAGLDQRVFAKIWSWARNHGVPTRPAEWRTKYPETPYGKETEAFLFRYTLQLERHGIHLDAWAREQVEMRLGFARRLRRQIRRIKPQLLQLHIPWAPWMGKIMLYYYYPEQLAQSPGWIRQLAEILVACEQLEAYSNRQRGQDYYSRETENLGTAFAYLDTLRRKQILTSQTVRTIQELTTKGDFDQILRAARGRPLSPRDIRFLRTLRVGRSH